MWHNLLTVLDYKLLLRSIASYKPWANIAPGVFYCRDRLENSSRVVSVNLPRSTFQPMCLVRGVKILSTFAYIFNRRNNMIIKYLVLGITLVYVVTVIIIYLKTERSV